MSHLEQWSAQLEAGEQTDPTLVLAARLAAEHPSISEPPTQFKTELRAQLLAQYDSGKPSLHLSRRVAAMLVVALIVAALAWIVRPQPVSAADILARASAVNADSIAAGLQSYQGVYTYGGRGFDNTGIQPQETFVWYKAPTLRRVEYYRAGSGNSFKLVDMSLALAPLPDNEKVRAAIINVSDGADAWSYNVQRGYVLRENPATFVSGGLSQEVVANTQPNGDIPGLLKAVGRDYQTATLLGTEMIAGRPAYKIELKHDIQNATTGLGITRVDLWIDQQTYLELGMERYTQYGNLLDRTVFTTIDINTRIDNSVFKFVPPASLKVIDARAKLAPAPSELTQLWTKVRVPYGVYVPSFIPTYLTPNGPVVEPDQFNDPAQLVYQTYGTASNPTALQLWQQASPVQTPEDYNGPGDKIQLGTLTAYYWEDDEFSSRGLIFVRGNTMISITVWTDIVSKDDLLKIGQSFQPLATGHP